MRTSPQLKRVADEFTQTALTRISALTRFFPRDANPDTVAHFIEQAVAGVIQQRLGRKHFVSGVLYNPTQKTEEDSAYNIVEGVVLDPDKGAVTLQNGRLAIINPEFCVGVIAIKASSSNLVKLGIRLGAIRKAHFRRLRAGCVMQVLIRDPEPGKRSLIFKDGQQFAAYDYSHPRWCPVFILFGYKNGQYEPHLPAIESFMANLHENIQPQF